MSLRVSAKFGLASGVLLLILLLQLVTGYIGLGVIKDSEDTILGSTNEQRLVQNLIQDWQNARHMQESFILEYPKIGVEQAYIQYALPAGGEIANMIRDGVTLRRIGLSSDPERLLPKHLDDLSAFQSHVDEYVTVLEEVIQLVKHLAADGSGLQTQLESQSTALLKTIQENGGTPELLSIYYKLRSYEKEYAIKRDTETAKAITDTILEAKAEVGNGSFDANQKDSLLVSLKSYNEVIIQIFETETEIQQKIIRLDQLDSDILPHLTSLLAVVQTEVNLSEQRINQAYQTLYIVQVLMFGVSLALAMGIGVLLHYSLTRNIVRLTQTASEFRAGNLKFRVVINARDELGTLAAAFNNMAFELEQTVTQLTNQTVDLKNANEQLSKLSITVEQSPASIIITNLNGEIEYVNPAFTRVSGYSLEESVGKKMNMLKSGNTPLETYQDLWQTIVSGNIWRGELLNRRKDGSLFWESTVIAPIRDDQERITHFAAVKEDVTAQKYMQDALRDSELRYRTLSQTANDAIVSADSAGCITGWNRGAEAIFGYPESEALNKDITLLMPRRYHENHKAGIERVSGDGERHVIGRKAVELHGIRNDKTEFPIEMSLAEWQVGTEKFYTAIIRDITDRKQAEENLRKTYKELERLNQELKSALKREAEMARTDSLTGVNNRRNLYELAGKALALAERHRQPFSTLMFDIDHFKKVNDSFGHAAGDQTLKKVAETVCGELRETDVMGRYGGEEFVIILPMTNIQSAYQLAERVRMAVSNIVIPTLNGDLKVTISIGVAEISRSGNKETFEDLIKRADSALYTAKQAGRNRTVVDGSKISE